VRSKEMYDITTDRVSLISIHSSKGLDFDLVYLVGIDHIRPTEGTKEALVSLVYVAMTRAKYRLVILYVEETGLIKRIRKCLSKWRDYYHPGFHGSFSLKSVLPAIIPEMSYANLHIQEGQLASLEYLKMIDPATPTEEKEKIRKDLLTYCGHDTLAMLKIREELISRSWKILSGF
jgi:hypothetical protein